MEKFGRDIRSYVIGGEFVGVIYCYFNYWIMNIVRGGKVEFCSDFEVEEFLVKVGRFLVREFWL